MLGRLCVAAIFIVAQAAMAEPLRFTVDHERSDLGFQYYFGDAPSGGSFPTLSADLSIDFDAVANSRISVSIDARQASANFPLATAPMRGSSVLAVDRFPAIHFTSTQVRLGAHPTILIDGDLTIRDITRSVTVTAILLAQGAEAIARKDAIIVRLEAQISRSAFGASGYADLVGDRLDLIGEIAVTR